MGFLDQPFLQGAPDEVAPPDTDSSFRKGLRSGFTGLQSQLHAAAGGVGAATGYSDFARDRYARSAELQEQAAAEAPPVRSYKDVNNLSSGYDYVTGLVGSSIPTSALAVGGALLGRGRPLVGSTAALTVPETGDMLQRQQNDPVASLRDPVERLGSALSSGVASAGVQSLAPAFVAKQITGKTAKAAITGQDVVARGAGTALLEGGAEGTAETIKQAGIIRDNPLKTFDKDAIIEAAIGGVAAGGAMAVPGGLSEYAHSRAQEAGGTISDAVKGTLAKTKEAVSSASKGLFSRNDDATARAVAGDKLVDSVPEGADPAAHVAENDAKATEWARAKLEGWLADSSLSDEQKAKAADLIQRVGEPAARAEIATMDLARKASAKATEFYEHMSKGDKVSKVSDIATKAWDEVSKAASTTADTAKDFYTAAKDFPYREAYDFAQEFKKNNPNATMAEYRAAHMKKFVGEDDAKKSEDYSGARAVIAKEIEPIVKAIKPEVLNNPGDMDKITNGIRLWIDQARKGEKPENNPKKVAMMRELLGTDATPALGRVYYALYGDEDTDAERKNVTDSILSHTDANVSHAKMADVVKKYKVDRSVPVDDAVDAMRQYVRGAHMPKGEKGAKASDHALRELVAKDEITKTFGKDADKVLDAFQKEYEDSKSKTELDKTSTQGEEGDLESGGDSDAATSGVADHSLEESDLEFEKPRYYKGLIRSHEAHVREFGSVKNNKGEDVTPSEARKYLKRAEKENPDRNVSFMSARDYAKANGLSMDEVAEMIGPEVVNVNDYGVVVAEGQKQEGRITDEQARAMRLDSKKHANSKSRINTDAKDSDGHPVTLDAHKITAQAMWGMRKSSGDKEPGSVKRMDDESNMRHVARAFFEGLASALIHFDAQVKSLPADLVVLRRKDGTTVTYAEIKDFRFKDPLMKRQRGEDEHMTGKGPLTDLSAAELHDMEINLHDRYARLYGAFKERLESETDGKKLSKEAYRKFSDKLYKEWKNSADVVALNALMDKVNTEIRGRDEREYSSDLTAHFRSDRSAMGNKGEEFGYHPSDADKRINRSLSEIKADMGLGAVANSEIDPQGQIHLAAKEHEKDGKAFTGGKKMPGSPETGMGIRHRFDESAPVTKRKGDEPAKPAADAEHVPARKSTIQDDAKDVLEGGSAGKAVLERAQSPIQIRALIAAINDTKGTKRQRANANDAIEVLNARMAEALKKSPDVAYALQLKRDVTEVGDGLVSETDKKHVEKYLDDVLPQIHVAWGRIMHAGQFEPGNGPHGMDTIRLSVHALDPMGTAYHESLHAFFKGLRERGNHEVMKVLYRASRTAPVMNQLRERFAGQPEVLKQIETDMEERVAYMYQLYAQEKITLGTDTKNMFGRIKNFIMEVLGMWTNDRRAEHIMDWFHEGNYKSLYDEMDASHPMPSSTFKSHMSSAITKVLMEPGTNKYVERLKSTIEPLARVERAVLGTGAARMRDTDLASLIRIADLIQPEVGKDSSDVGFIQAHKNEHVQRMNILAKRLRNFDEATLEAAHDALRDKVKRGLPAEVQQARDAVRSYLDEQYDYMKAAGVNVRDLGYKDDYFPRVYDKDYVSRHSEEFVKVLESQGISNADKVLNKIMSTEGAADMEMPGMQHLKERKIDEVPKEFLEKNLYRALNGYTLQATRRAEWARRFEPDNSGIKNLLAQARKEGATQEEIDMAQDFIRAIDGTLGDDIDPTWRRWFGNAIVYQNVRLLPLALFSQFVDPGGIKVRGGTMGDAYNAFTRGIKEVFTGTKKDEWRDLAEDIGAIDDTVLMKAVGTSYTQGMVSDNARKVNDMLFKFNRVEQFAISMRVAATEAAVKFMFRHADGKYSPHSARWLAELGYMPGEIKVMDKRPLIHAHEFVAAGMDDKAAIAASNKMKGAINKWIDGAILRPNQADKPIWMNDPRFMLIAHLKQFVYAFQNTILKRAWTEAEHGNYGPVIALAGYVPMMIAADLVKGMIQGGGEQPEWKKNWGMSEYIHAGIERAGLYGVGQFGTDFMQDVSRGGAGISSLLGPTVEQLADALYVVGGKGQYEPFVMRSMPANALYAHAFKAPATDPTFSN